MSSSGAAKRAESQKNDLSEILNQNVREAATRSTRTKTKEISSAFENIAANTFFKIMFDEQISPEDKKAAAHKAMVFEGTKQEVRARVREFTEFQEYLQHVREEMAQEIIRLTDTDAFSELQSTYAEFHDSMIDFNNAMTPLTEIIDAIYDLRTNGLTFDAFEEIKNDRDAEAELAKFRAEKQDEMRRQEQAINDLLRQNASLGQQRGMFGFGGVKESARMEIARNAIEIENKQKALDEARKALEEAAAARRAEKSKLGEFSAQKDKLRELLDISSEDHKERQKTLVDKALNFVTTAKTRVGSVRSHLDQMDGQVENLFDANSRMRGMYSILNDALVDAEASNQSLREKYAGGVEAESMIAKMEREDKRTAIEEHIGVLSAAATDTMETFADLTSQATRVRTMKEANRSQSEMARRMHSQGIAGVADRLSVVLQAVSSAALNESSSMAKDTLAKMSQSTNAIAQKESIRLAMGQREINNDLDKALADLEQYGEVQRTATNITREAVGEMRLKLEELQALAHGVQDDLRESIAVHADVAEGTSAKTIKTGGNKKSQSPFGFGA
jgi:hypothetical protein